MLKTEDLPKFGPMGADPPLRSEPVIICRAFFGVPLDRPSPQATEAIRLLVSGQDEVYRRFPEAVQWMREGSHALQLYKAEIQNPRKKAVMVAAGVGASVGLLAAAAATGGLALVPAIATAGAAVGLRRGSAASALHSRFVSKLSSVEFRRVVYSQQWVRNDEPPMQISPGNTQKDTIRQKVGVSRTKSKELSLALGLSNIGRTGLGTQISGRIGTTLTIDEEREVTKEVQVTNDRSGYYRRMAFWYVRHELAVDALIASSAGVSNPAAEAQGLQWIPRDSISFVSPYAGHTTSTDVPA